MFKCFGLRVSVIRVFRCLGVVVFHFWLGRNKHDPKYNIVPFRHILEKTMLKTTANFAFGKGRIKKEGGFFCVQIKFTIFAKPFQNKRHISFNENSKTIIVCP